MLTPPSSLHISLTGEDGSLEVVQAHDEFGLICARMTMTTLLKAPVSDKGPWKTRWHASVTAEVTSCEMPESLYGASTSSTHLKLWESAGYSYWHLHVTAMFCTGKSLLPGIFQPL